MQNQNENKDTENKMKNKLSRILTNKKKLTKNLKLKEKELVQLRKDLNEARKTSKGGNNAVKSLNERLTKYQKDIDEKSRTIDKLRDENQNKNDIISQLREEIEEMKNKSISISSKTKKVEKPEKVEKEFEAHPIASSEHEKEDEGEYQDDEYEDEYKDDVEQQDPNIIDDDVQGVEEDEQIEEPRGELKAIINESEVDPIFEKLKLLLQRNGIKYHNMNKLFPDSITIMTLEHKLKSLGMKDAEERLTLCRYIIEPRAEKKVEFNENRSISKENAENVLKSKIDDYDIYQYNAEEFNERIRSQVKRYANTLREALELEDLNSSGYIPANTLKS